MIVRICFFVTFFIVLVEHAGYVIVRDARSYSLKIS